MVLWTGVSCGGVPDKDHCVGVMWGVANEHAETCAWGPFGGETLAVLEVFLQDIYGAKQRLKEFGVYGRAFAGEGLPR